MNKKYVITGAPGTGKTSIINELTKRNFNCIYENSREVISEQIIKGGDILPWKNQIAFENTIANMRAKQYLTSPKKSICFFDRSAVDCAAYLKSNNLKVTSEIIKIIKRCTFNSTAFYTPIWEEIYKNDNERIEKIEQAKEIEGQILYVYRRQGYRLIEIPKISVIERVNFILSRI